MAKSKSAIKINPRAETEPASEVKFSAAGFIRCRVCRCTEIQPCEPPCSWSEVDLCSGCAKAAGALCDWYYGAHSPNFAALVREYKRQVRDNPIPYVLTEESTR